LSLGNLWKNGSCRDFFWIEINVIKDGINVLKDAITTEVNLMVKEGCPLMNCNIISKFDPYCSMCVVNWLSILIYNMVAWQFSNLETMISSCRHLFDSISKV
jgi:hypothetical protein